VLLCILYLFKWVITFVLHSLINILQKVSNRLHCCIGRCHQNCTSNTCWGPKPSDCQQLNKVICADQCDYRCFGPEVYECKAYHITVIFSYHSSLL